jgi:hypothetical protein
MAMNASADAANAARRAADHPWFERLARFGYVANGILHGVLGALALVLATGGSAQADQSGAIQALASQPFGEVLLWVCAAGSLLLCLWNISQAFLHSDKLRTRIKFVSTGLVFLLTGGAFSRYAIGSGGDSTKTATSLSGELMGHPAGQITLIIFGATVIGIGGFFVFRGVTHRFLKDLKTTGGTAISPAVKITGTVGYIAKGLVLGALGLLFIVATIQHDPEEATGIDGALKAIRDQSFGSVALAAIGAGLLAYAVYLLFRARYDSMD